MATIKIWQMIAIVRLSVMQRVRMVWIGRTMFRWRLAVLIRSIRIG